MPCVASQPSPTPTLTPGDRQICILAGRQFPRPSGSHGYCLVDLNPAKPGWCPQTRILRDQTLIHRLHYPGVQVGPPRAAHVYIESQMTLLPVYTSTWPLSSSLSLRLAPPVAPGRASRPHPALSAACQLLRGLSVSFLHLLLTDPPSCSRVPAGALSLQAP